MHLYCGGFWIPCFLPNVNSNRPSPRTASQTGVPCQSCKPSGSRRLKLFETGVLQGSLPPKFRRSYFEKIFILYMIYIYIYTYLYTYIFIYIYIVGYRWCTTRTPLDEVFNINKNQQRGATQTLFFAAQVVCHHLSFRHGKIASSPLGDALCTFSHLRSDRSADMAQMSLKSHQLFRENSPIQPILAEQRS